MLARGESPFWLDIIQRLITAADSGRLVAPIPKETIVETLGCRQETRIAIRDISMRLSKGLFFKQYFTILAEETLALVRPQMLTSPVEIGNWNDNIADGPLVETTYQDITSWKNVVEQRVGKLKDPIPTDGFSHKDFYDAICISRAQDFSKQIEKMISGQLPDPESLFIDLCNYLANEMVTLKELEALKQAILKGTWDSIPVLSFHSQLSAISEQQMSTGGKKTCNPRRYSANDELDRTRMAVGLAYSDLVITENPLAAVIRQCGIDEVMEVKVLGVSEEESIAAAITGLIR